MTSHLQLTHQMLSTKMASQFETELVNDFNYFQQHVVQAFSYLNCFKNNLESICCPSYEMNTGSLTSMGFNNMMHAIIINY